MTALCSTSEPRDTSAGASRITPRRHGSSRPPGSPWSGFPMRRRPREGRTEGEAESRRAEVQHCAQSCDDSKTPVVRQQEIPREGRRPGSPHRLPDGGTSPRWRRHDLQGRLCRPLLPGYANSGAVRTAKYRNPAMFPEVAHTRRMEKLYDGEALRAWALATKQKDGGQEGRSPTRRRCRHACSDLRLGDTRRSGLSRPSSNGAPSPVGRIRLAIARPHSQHPFWDRRSRSVRLGAPRHCPVSR